jgi:hypothetical protein
MSINPLITIYLKMRLLVVWPVLDTYPEQVGVPAIRMCAKQKTVEETEFMMFPRNPPLLLTAQTKEKPASSPKNGSISQARSLVTDQFDASAE